MTLKWRDRVIRVSKRASPWASTLALAGLIALGIAAVLPASVHAQAAAGTSSVEWVFLDATGKPLPFKTDDEIEEFLLTATIVEMEEIPVGITDPRKARLEKNGIQLYACFRDVDIHRRQETLPGIGIRRNWRDCCKFECAAYRLGKLLGLRNIPPVVMREIKGKEITLQIWVEGALMETDRASQKINPPNPWRHGMQWQVMHVFDALIHNDDRNAGNMLYDRDWKLWLIDHTRCFPQISDLPKTLKVKHCEKNLWENLQNLDEEVVKERLDEYLESAELKALFQRREKLVQYIEDQIEQRGERQVLFSFY